MATALKPIAHEERLTIVDHLDELRSRLITCAIAFVVIFAACFWQNHALLDFLNVPLKESTQSTQGNGRLAQAANAQQRVGRGLTAVGDAVRAIGADPAISARTKAALGEALPRIREAAAALPRTTPPRVPITTGVGEPFTATLTVVAYFALLFSLPIILYQAYAFILPAFSPSERRVALPLMLMVPFLFVAGVVFGYYLVVPPAISFLQNFNDTDFDVLLQAKDYYRFAVMALLSCGLIFQLPVGLLAVNHVGILTGRQLRGQWRYAIVIIAVVAALMPGVDPVTTCILMVPLLLLYGLSIVLLTIADRRRGNRDEIAALEPLDGDDTEGS
ncbi:twin-arginine translocase subunit TatC [Conexibacter sp. JD483]|uniref:twin-arginine translocase subunit TatC n=1 Tax=unclassified Conexibacter TaxID=2627773 RepID=UPI002725C237|nr:MULTISPECIES: twin-arginine translocase subunit TatC [unclassified Conexibacter]MDO8184416.1 twin-arginine translocase subunit TatC [Conexibacter sp. CPCC 205706]MDO8197722.1 twin-arginine translocase subunit TatC [Conexibacter sp. CPCC 205762]MDR9368142.1 twin-arginine translocase subunit TatC [Conexibacter sp. JD483]